VTDSSSTQPPRSVADIRPELEQFINNPGDGRLPGWSDDVEIDELFRDLPGTTVTKGTGSEVPLYLTQEAYDPTKGRRALGNLTTVAHQKAERDCARMYPYFELNEENEQLLSRVAEQFCERWWNHLEETPTGCDYKAVERVYIDQYTMWYRYCISKLGSEFPADAARRMNKPPPPTIGPTHYPKPMRWDNRPDRPGSETYGDTRIDANLDPRDYYDLAEYITQWLFCLGHNAARSEGAEGDDWDFVRGWWADVEALREADTEPAADEFTEYKQDGQRLLKVARGFTYLADDSKEAEKKLLWRYLNDLHERLKQLYPDDTPSQPPAVDWHLSGTVTVTDIREVPGGHLYELELVDERRLNRPIRVEVEVPNDGEAEIREADHA
jgi:hypothetical protein